MKFLTLVLLLVLPMCLFAQEHYTSTDKEAIKNYVLANQDMDNSLYDEATVKLQKAIEIDPKFVEAQMQLGGIYQLKGMYKESIPYLRAAIAINPNVHRAVYLKLGEAEISNSEYAIAKAHLEKYLEQPYIIETDRFKAHKLIADCNFSIEAIKHPVQFTPINMGAEVNTADDEYLPVTTADESMLIFTRKINNNEDFYKSSRINGKWQTSVPLSAQINTRYNEGAQSISQDGKVLFFTGCNRPDGLGRCDIYISLKRGNDWSKPFDLSQPLNTSGWESQPSISADGRTLYFVSNRKGGYGGYDIWKSKLSDKGWGEPINMGPKRGNGVSQKIWGTPLIPAVTRTA
jgi:tetratricopeptide (TPR) repeat protein